MAQPANGPHVEAQPAQGTPSLRRVEVEHVNAGGSGKDLFDRVQLVVDLDSMLPNHPQVSVAHGTDDVRSAQLDPLPADDQLDVAGLGHPQLLAYWEHTNHNTDNYTNTRRELKHVLAVRRRAGPILRSPATRVAGTAVGLVVLVHGINTPQALEGLRETDVHWLLVAVALTALSLGAGAGCWGVLVRSDRRISWRRLSGWYAEGVFAGQVLPTGVGGDAVRAIEVNRAAGAPIALASVAGSRVVSAIAMALWGLAGAVLLRSALGPAALGAAALFAAATLVAGVLALNAERLIDRLHRGGRRRARLALRMRPFAATLSSYGRRRDVVGLVVLLALAGWALHLAALTILARSLGIGIGWQVVAVAMPLTLMATWVPIAANGVGVKEGILVGILAHTGVDATHAATLSLLVDLQLVPFAAVGVLVWLVRRRAAVEAETAELIPEVVALPQIPLTSPAVVTVLV
jgi:uncharacterized protein (TIRG00374 family)